MPRKKPKQLRGSLLVDSVLDATLEQLSAKGFEGLSIEEVAESAGVNKTTIYRRWPTKSDLARSALDCVSDALVVTKDHGSLRKDLIALLATFRDFAVSVRGQTLMRMMLADDSDMARLARSVRRRKESVRQEIVDRAVGRGELPLRTDAKLVFETLMAALHHQVLFVRGSCDDRWIAKVVDLIICGAAHPPKSKRR